jgi:hypothetical protein
MQDILVYTSILFALYILLRKKIFKRNSNKLSSCGCDSCGCRIDN